VKLMPGQKVWVRGNANVAVASAVEPAVPRAEPPAAEPPPAPGTYQLRDGDNLWVVAKRFHLKISDLARWNNLDPEDVVHPGQEIKLSGPGQ
jgi:LysM repeat protein